MGENPQQGKMSLLLVWQGVKEPKALCVRNEVIGHPMDDEEIGFEILDVAAGGEDFYIAMQWGGQLREKPGRLFWVSIIQ
jgi:hypothetical protein